MKNMLKYYIATVMFLFSMFVLPIVMGSYAFGKNWFLGAAGLLGLLVWLVEIFLTKRKVKGNRVLTFMFLLELWSLISWLRLPVGVRMRSLMSPIGWGMIVVMLVWVFLWLQVSDKKEFDRQFKFLSWSGVVVAVTSLVVFMLPESKMPLSWPQENPLITFNSGWSVTGSLQSEMVLFLFLTFEWVRRLMRKLRLSERGGEVVGYVMEAVAVVFFGLMMLLGLYRIYKMGWVAMDIGSAWVVAVESLKRMPIFGVGIGNFLQAFNLYRPASYNLTPYWSTGFLVSGMGFLQMWTELGLGGLVLVFLLIRGWLKRKADLKGAKKIEFWRAGVFLAIFLCLPMNLLTVFLLAWLMSTRVFETGEGVGLFDDLELRRRDGSNVNVVIGLKIGLAVIVVGLVSFGSYWWGKILLGEIYLRRSFVAMAKNDGGAAYDWQFRAMRMNSRSVEYRRFYSQTNLSLAQTLLSEEGISDEEKQQASVLVQQAVNEAKAAVVLDREDAVGWANLAGIYRALAGMVEGSADWSLQAYQQAVALNPMNSVLRLDLGSLLFAAGRYEEADRVFEQVVVNKQNFANGWYNWAHNAKKMNRLAEAVARLSQAVALVSVDSGDYEKASDELAEWKTELDAAVAEAEAAKEVKQAETLRVSEPLPVVGEEGQVDVPTEELEPPKMELVPMETEMEPVEGEIPTEEEEE